MSTERGEKISQATFLMAIKSVEYIAKSRLPNKKSHPDKHFWNNNVTGNKHIYENNVIILE